MTTVEFADKWVEWNVSKKDMDSYSVKGFNFIERGQH